MNAEARKPNLKCLKNSIFSCKVLRTYSYKFPIRKNSTSLCNMYILWTNEENHLFSTFVELLVAATFAKTLQCQNGVMVSDSFDFRKTKRCICSLSAEVQWQLKCLYVWMARDKSWIIKSNINRTLHKLSIFMDQ